MEHLTDYILPESDLSMILIITTIIRIMITSVTKQPLMNGTPFTCTYFLLSPEIFTETGRVVNRSVGFDGRSEAFTLHLIFSFFTRLSKGVS